MRVEIVGEIASFKDRFLPGRSEPLEIQREPSSRKFSRGAQRERLLFEVQDFIAGFPGQSGEMHGAYAGQFVIVFRRLDLSANCSLYSILSQTLQELLKKASSSDALFATLCVTAPAKEETRAP